MTAPTADRDLLDGDLRARAESAIDPRFRDRRIAVRRDEGRRRLKRLVVLVAVAAVALGTVIVFRSPILDVDEISISGIDRISGDEVTDVVGIDLGAPVLLADLGAAEAALEALPWVSEATVRRVLPGTIEVDIVERVAVAKVVAGASTAVVDADGLILELVAVGTVPALLPVVLGDDDTVTVGRRLSENARAAATLGARLGVNPRGTVASIDARDGLVAELADGGTADFGGVEDLDAKIEAFRTVVARVDLTCLDTIDLRVPTHPVLTRESACS